MTEFALTSQDIRAAATTVGLEQHADALVGLALPAGRVLPRYVKGAESLDEVRAASGAPVGATKVGGLPDLPADVEWPRGEWGPMTFCMQVRADELGVLRTDLGLDEGKVLAFFADREPDCSNATAGAVLVLDAAGLERRMRPDDVHQDFYPDEFPYTEAQADVRLTLTLPDFNVVSERLGLADDDWERWEKLVDALERAEGRDPDLGPVAARSHVLGHPGAEHVIHLAVVDLVGRGNVEQESRCWRLLGAFSSEEPLWIEIADGGSFFFVVPCEDCLAGNFERVRVVMESC